MQFSVLAFVTALAASASATYVPSYNATSVVYPTGTSAPTGTGAPVPTSTSVVPFPGAASKQGVAGSAFAVVVAGGVALMM